MAYDDSSRIRSNTHGLRVIHSLRDANRRVQLHELRLATGKRIGNAADDAAGSHRAVILSARSRSLSQIMNNIGEARHLLQPAESGLQGIQDILVNMRSRILQSANGTLGDEERQVIAAELVHMREEIDAISEETSFNGVKLLGSDTTFTFQTGETSQTTHTTGDYGVAAMGMSRLKAMQSGDVIDGRHFQGYLEEIHDALSTVSSGLTDIGSMTNRLESKEQVIGIQQSNVAATLSRIDDADAAMAQLNLMRSRFAHKAALVAATHASLDAQAVLNLLS